MMVNYVREHERFIEYAADERLSANEQLLWYALVHIFNQRAEGNEWPDGFIRITNDRMFTYLPIKWDAMARARNALKQRGLIDFRGGNRNKAAPEYKINWFYPSCYPLKTDNTGGNAGDNTGGNAGGNPGDIYNKHKQEININQRETDEDDDDDIHAGGRARENPDPITDREERRARITAGFRVAFGRDPYPAETDRLVVVSWRKGFDSGMVVLAMEKAARNGARNPVELTISVLQEWRENVVRTPEQAERYQAEYDKMAGRHGMYGTGNAAEDYLAVLENRMQRAEEIRRAGIGQ